MKQLQDKTVNRETWLQQANEKLQEKVFDKANLIIPHDVKISVGFPLGYRAGCKNETVGVCHPRSHSDAGVNEIFINPTRDDGLEILGTLVHEDIHAIDDCADGHGSKFRSMALACGLTGKMTATTNSPELEETLQQIILELGDYPHAKVKAYKKKQSARMLKHVCSNDCGASFYQSAKQSEKNPMLCSNCSGWNDDGDEYLEIYMVQA